MSRILKIIIPVTVCIALLVAAPGVAGNEVPVAEQTQAFVDDFGDAEFNGRQAERGAWQFNDGVASCVADPVLYKKYKNHGPILKWPRKFEDAHIQFEMKAKDCQRVVFTLNGDGHIFRVTLADERPDAPAGTSKVPTRLIAWATKSSKQNKGDTIKPNGLPDLSILNDEWVKVNLDVKGKHAVLAIGDFQAEISHAALARDKSMVMLTFAHGEIAVRNFSFSPASGSASTPLTPEKR